MVVIKEGGIGWRQRCNFGQRCVREADATITRRGLGGVARQRKSIDAGRTEGGGRSRRTGRVNGYTIIPVTGSRLCGGRRRNRVAPCDTAEFPRLLLDYSGFRLWTRCTLGLLPGLITSTEFIEAKRTRTQVSALIKSALVANDLSRIQRRSAPGRRLGGMTIEAAAAKILCLLRGGIVCVVDGMTRGKVGNTQRMAGGGSHSPIESRLRRDHHGCISAILELNMGTLFKRTEISVGGRIHCRDKRL